MCGRNLPNIPFTGGKVNLRNGRISSTYVVERSSDQFPRLISAALLELHYVCLIQAKVRGLLNPTGAILSSIGARVALEIILELADLAGYSGKILTFWWKNQRKPDSVLGAYAEYEKKGLGPVSLRARQL